ncbi:MAG: peptide chain release factor N(5)-glutamine methyltransferase [Candidatus Omnitrophica bacterium]|nr:peptide chain release factor N(5)-glutamine methyltransferase [Candidatus Omnitrophota bacterium]MDD5488634.1 peptide chain release factor N(5)-glutamine methyltransferase [Candidatus Omnitrophota bacterium]
MTTGLVDDKRALEDTPTQYLRGWEDFMGIRLNVDPRVLIPRPETELLVAVAAETLRKSGVLEPAVLDIGTGSGAIALGLLKLLGNCRLIACDISKDALNVAESNIMKLGCASSVELMFSDVFSAFGPEHEDMFDAILSNPPYVSDKDYEGLDEWVKAEPRVALCSGPEGMDHITRILSRAMRYLKPGGFAAIEIGYDQAAKVRGCFRDNGFVDVRSYADPAGYERVVAGRKNG